MYEGSCQVQAQCCGQAVSGCTTRVPVAAVPSTPAKERPAALASTECFKCLQPEEYCGMVECVFVLSLFCCLFFAFSIVFSDFDP